MTFRFGARSLGNLEGVKRELRLVCNRALELTYLDFGIIEGIRSEERQRHLVSAGKSQTMNSKHLTGDAIDFMPYWKGKPQTAWPYYYSPANAFLQASKDLSIQISWGGAFGMDMWSFRNVHDAQEAYLILRAKRSGLPFLDGPHIELTDTPPATLPA